jgi:hypothetical protein
MALSPTLKRAVRCVADLLGEYGREQGWGPDDYQLFFRVSGSWGNIHVVFVARGFEGHDPFECYSSVMQYLRDQLRTEPDLFGSIGLVIRTFKEVEEGGIFAIGPSYVEVKPKGRRDLLKRTVRLVAGALTQYAGEQGWDDKEYWIYYSIDPEWDQVRFYFVARGFDGRDNAESERSMGDYLKTTLSSEPAVLNSLRLRVSGKEQIDSGEIRLGAGFKEYWTFTHS